MKFKYDLSHFILFAFYRWWVILICASICASFTIPVAQRQYAERVETANSYYGFYNENMDKNYAVYSAYYFDTGDDITSGEIANLDMFNTVFQANEYYAAEILKDLNDRISFPLDELELKRDVQFYRTAGEGNAIRLRAVAKTLEDAELIREAVNEKVGDIYTEIIPDARGITINNVAYVDWENRLTQNAPENIFPEYGSVLLYCAAICVGAGFFIGCLIVLIWNGINPVIETAPMIESRWSTPAFKFKKGKNAAVLSNVIQKYKNIGIFYDEKISPKKISAVLAAVSSADAAEKIYKSTFADCFTKPLGDSLKEDGSAFLILCKSFRTAEAELDMIIERIKNKPLIIGVI